VDDLSIRGGLVVDGTGAAGREADVSVSNGRLVAVEPRAPRPARRLGETGRTGARQKFSVLRDESRFAR